MSQILDDLPSRAALTEVARDFHARGWMAGTAGNLFRENDIAFGLKGIEELSPPAANLFEGNSEIAL